MKTLIVYAKAGAGHRRAAEAVYAAFERKGQEKDVTMIDCLDYTAPWFRNFYPNVVCFCNIFDRRPKAVALLRPLIC